MRSRVLSVVVAAALCGTAACGASESSDSPPPSGSPAESPPSPSAGSPRVAPASGQQLALPNAASFRLPEGSWVVVGEGTRTVTAARSLGGGIFNVDAGEFPAMVSDLDRAGETELRALRDYPGTAGLRRLANREVGGREGWVLAGRRHEDRVYHFGTVHEGIKVTFGFEFPADWPDGKEQVESVLASIRWS